MLMLDEPFPCTDPAWTGGGESGGSSRPAAVSSAHGIPDRAADRADAGQADPAIPDGDGWIYEPKWDGFAPSSSVTAPMSTSSPAT